MASLEQWTEWKEDYLRGLEWAIRNCAFIYANTDLHNRGIHFNAQKAFKLVLIADKRGYFKENDPSYLFKIASFCYFSGINQRRWLYSAEDANRDYRICTIKHEDIVSALANSQGYLGGVSFFVYVPFLEAVGYILKNKPLLVLEILKKFDEKIDLSYCGLTRTQLFAYFRSMKPFGLYKLLVDIKCPQAEDLFDSVQKNSFDRFEHICNNNNIDLTNVSNAAGYCLSGQSIKILEDDPDTIKSKYQELFKMVGTQGDNMEELYHKIHNHEFICEVLPFDLTEEESKSITVLAYNISIFLQYYSIFEEEECKIINRLIDNPHFTGFKKIVEFVSIILKNPIPYQVSRLLTSEEKERFLPNIEEESCEQTLSPQPGSVDNNSKTLSSRWMTDPYQRMTDDTLVELISRKIWPQLLEEVDGLQWTPAKRALPSFEKTKNMLAACILFHALELAKIAKLPKQEEDEVSDVEYMSAEDRAQAGISATSNRDAGIVHTKKKYNDTLPVGYMEVLEKFIPEEKLPGRTTSRTYLKLVNKWVKMKLESVRDNIDSEASAKLFIAECKSDLGPQFYLYQDNRVKMKALLKEWKDQLPDIFNVPI